MIKGKKKSNKKTKQNKELWPQIAVEGLVIPILTSWRDGKG